MEREKNGKDAGSLISNIKALETFMIAGCENETKRMNQNCSQFTFRKLSLYLNLVNEFLFLKNLDVRS